MNIFHVIILGIIEGITEFLPISSTAHLALVSHLMGLPDSDFMKTFEIGIQLGAILAVVVLYAKRFATDMETMKRVVVAFIPTALIGFALYKVIKGLFLSDYPLMIGALLIGGALLIVFEKMHFEDNAREDDITKLSYKKAFIIGCAQAVAVVPGVSRSAATIVGGMLLGVTRRAIVEFSFLLAVPTMLAATGYDLLKSHASIAAGEYGLFATGFVVAGISAYFAVAFLLNYIKSHSFVAFGIYRIVFAILMFGLLFGF